jgi:hypothetical protein
MLGGAGHRFVIEGKQPIVFLVAVGLLFANTFLLLLLPFGAEHLLSKGSLNSPPCEALAANGVQYHAPGIVCWYAGHSITIQFVILALLAAIFVVFRKRVRYIPPR